jgi:hypothetical protein
MEIVEIKSGKFESGQIVITPGIVGMIQRAELDVVPYLARHLAGDWGDMDDEDKATNDESMETGLRVMSAYEIEAGKIWIITEADRSCTTVLLPEEY